MRTLPAGVLIPDAIGWGRWKVLRLPPDTDRQYRPQPLDTGREFLVGKGGHVGRRLADLHLERHPAEHAAEDLFYGPLPPLHRQLHGGAHDVLHPGEVLETRHATRLVAVAAHHVA